MTKKELKRHFDAYYKIYKKLQEFVVTDNIQGLDVELKVTQVYFIYDPEENDWYIDEENYELEAHCELSKWAEVMSDGHTDWCDWFDGSVSDEARKLVKEEIKTFVNNLDENIYPEFFDWAFWQTRHCGSTKTKHFDGFVNKYNQYVEQHLESLNNEIKEKEIKEKPEEFISVNGVLLSKKEIKALAATL